MIEISLTLINWACDFVVGIHGGSAKYHLDNALVGLIDIEEFLFGSIILFILLIPGTSV